MSEQENEVTRKRGRPKKDRNIIAYREGNRFKIWNVDAGVNENFTPSKMSGNVPLYQGLGFDWVVWGRILTRRRLFNAAKTTPFLKPIGVADANIIRELEEAYKSNAKLKSFMDACSELFEGRKPETSIPLSGSYFVRVLSSLFIPEAGAEEIGRSRAERPEGKVWGSVTVLPVRGTGYNYTEKEWFYLRNASIPVVFAVKIVGDEYESEDTLGISEKFAPEELADAILHGLWGKKGVNSCEADVSATAEATQTQAVASDDPEPSVLTPEVLPPLTSDPDAVSVEAKDTTEHEATMMTESTHTVDEPSVPVIPEATPPALAATWGEIKGTQVWLKGLSSSKELQASAPLSKVLDTIVSHEVTKQLTDECRAIDDKKARNEFKRDNFHVLYPSAVFAGRLGGSTRENVVGYTGLACLDFDDMASMEDAENTRDDIFMEFPEVLFCAVSASGRGVYAIVPLEFDGSEAGYKAALSAAMESFECKGFMPDTGCVDATRARYMSSDPDALSRPDGYVVKPFSASVEGGFILPASMLRTCWTNSGRKRKGAGKAYLDEALRRIETAQEGMKDTTITSVMGSVARLIRNYNLEPEKTYEKVRQVAFACGYDTKKTDDKIRRLGIKNEGGTL